MPITETFFPALLQACDDDPNDTSDIQLTCGICHEQMTLEDGTDPHLRAFVLPCMHIYCNGCVDAMVAHHKSDNQSHYTCPTCRMCLHCATCRAPTEKGHLLQREVENSIALTEDILKLWHNLWNCFSCDMKIYTFWLQILVRIFRDCTELVDKGQILRIIVKYQGETWGEPCPEVDCWIVEQGPLPPPLEAAVKIIETGLLKVHSIAVPTDDSTAFRYELRLYEMRDKEFKHLAWERKHIEQTEREMREGWVGSQNLTALDLAFDLREFWSDVNVRKKMDERAERARESVLDYMEDNEDEEPDVYVV